MKKIINISIVLLVLLGFGGCSPFFGAIYTNNTLPISVDAANNGEGIKTGVAVCKSVFGLIAWGDCSIDTAKKEGGITQVTSIDAQSTFVLLGIYSKFVTTVKGE